MNDIAQLHPEDLLDRHYAGTLSKAERRRLDGHLQGCATCRFELAVGDDLDDEAHEKDPDLSHLVLGAVPNRAAPNRAAPDRAASDEGRARLRGAKWLWVLAAIVVAGSAGAAYLGARAGSAPPPHEPTSGRSVGIPSESDPVTAVPTSDPPSDIVDETEVEVSAPTARPAEPSPETASSLFAAANAARRAGRREEALQRYGELQTRFPESREARTSRAIVAELVADDDPAAAVSAYDDYLGEGGRLGEEALVGRAEALGKAGRHAEEAAGWRELLARYPASIHATRARARLAAIGAAKPSPDASQK
ncbi:MAG: zf-HC2 domain-containing protein [Polyangiaceae bacterium]